MASRRRSAAVRLAAAAREGSGFVASVEHRLIVTARHCIEQVPDGVADAVALYFLHPDDWGKLEPRSADRTGMVIKRGAGPDDDWAVVRVSGDLPHWAQALPMCDLAIDGNDDWGTAGYPPVGVIRDIGDDFGGKVVYVAALVKLADPSAPGRLVSGISGAACVIEGRAFGVIIRADEHSGLSTTGLFYALPFSRIARDMAPDLAFERNPAFLELATSYLEAGVGLNDIIEKLLYENAAEIRQLPRFVARLALIRGVALMAQVACRALTRHREEASELVDVAAAQWLPVASARWLAGQLTSAPPALRAAALNVACPDLATLCVRRAGFELNRDPNWHSGRIDVSWIPGVDEDDDLVGEVTRLLYRRLLAGALGAGDDWRPHVAKVAAELVEWFDPARNRWSVQFVLLPIGSPRTAVDRLAATYPALAIVVPTGGDHITTAEAPLVDPALCPHSEHLAEWRRARRQIALPNGGSR